MKPTRAIILATLASSRGWVTVQGDVARKCRALCRDGAAEENDAGQFRATPLGRMSAKEIDEPPYD